MMLLYLYIRRIWNLELFTMREGEILIVGGLREIQALDVADV